MKAIAWSQNLTAEKCAAAGVGYVSKDELFRQSDFITIHIVLSARCAAWSANEIALMKSSAFLINTSRGPIVDEAALVAALREKKIGGAGLDVFDVEPLPLDHPFRTMDNVVITPHLGYVAEQTIALISPAWSRTSGLPRRQAGAGDDVIAMLRP